MAQTPHGCRFPPTPQLSARKRELFPSPLNRKQPFGSILSEIDTNTPRRSTRIANNKLVTVCEADETTPSSRHLYLSDNSSDLGHMSPLELSSSPDRYDSPFHNTPCLDTPSALLARPRFFAKKGKDISEYTSFEDLASKIDDDEGMPLVDVNPETPRKSFSGIFVRKDPLHDKENIENRNINTIYKEDIESILDEDSIVPETPEKHSPSANLRTPHEISFENVEPPKLYHRKSLTEVSSSNVKENVSKLKRHLSKDCFDTVQNKVPKLTEQAPKARTSLFSTKSFYPQVQRESTMSSKITNYFGSIKNDDLTNRSHARRSQNHRVIRKTRKDGQINLGVQHKIRKPKPKRPNTTQLLKAALNIMDNSPLNSYLNNSFTTENINGTDNNPLATNSNNNQTLNTSFNSCFSEKTVHRNPVNEFSISLNITENDNSNEENEENRPARKFFKSKRSLANKLVKLQDNLIINIKSKNDKEKEVNKSADFSFNTSDSFKEADGDLTKVQSEVEKLLSEWKDSDESWQEETANRILDNEDSLVLDCQKLSINNNNVDAGLLSPTSQLSNMTSVMALDSPAIASNASTEQTNNNNKLYPLFYKGFDGGSADVYDNSFKKTRSKKMWKPHKIPQYQLDAGQKKIGLTYCAECDFVYEVADPDEELFHYNYHNSLHILNFKGWKNESVISVLVNVGRVIHIKCNSPKSWFNRVQQVLELVDNEIGAFSEPFELDESSQVYLMANAKQIIGILLAKTLSKAHRMISSIDSIDLCTEESFDVKCGISRLWIAPPFRRKGYATHMLNAMRCNFMFGKVLDLDEIAFSSPTEAGLTLAKKFSGREDFLVFQEA
ncbi:N-acetyltransferase ESCO2-like [Ctenocephalides felis]|uniref:N-acetyltransferase ESCO2-like n=1 Tax=Ctenocephalides felis TaxID=7515 RepID=UPI000E6E2DDD|nr:N-acetyltransferase ESCO2-like [Ctenocephalides felis]